MTVLALGGSVLSDISVFRPVLSVAR